MFTKNRFFATIIAGLIFGAAYADTDNTLYVEDTSVELGNRQITLPIYMENSMSICSMQFEVVLPEGLFIPYDEEDGVFSIEKGARCKNKHNIFCRRQANGVYRIMIASSSNNDFYDSESKKDLPICSITINIPSDYSFGSDEIVLTNMILNHFDIDLSDAITRYTPSDVSCRILSSPTGIEALIGVETSNPVYDFLGRMKNKVQSGTNIINRQKLVVE